MSWNNITQRPNYLNSDQQIYSQKTTLESADILDLFDTPVIMLPKPGPDKVNIIVGIILVNNPGATPYAGANPLRFRFGSKTEIFETSAAFLNSATQVVLQVPQKEASSTENSAIDERLYAYVPVANPTAGDGTVDVYVFYRTLTLG
jgi:hypothetical protein